MASTEQTPFHTSMDVIKMLPEGTRADVLVQCGTAPEFPVSPVIGMPPSNYMELSEAALEKLFKENFKPLCTHYQYKFGFDIDIAKDLVHTGFIKLWENRASISPGLSVKAYLSKIINNLSLDVLKHERVKEKYAIRFLQRPSTHASDDFQESAIKQLETEIDQAVATLPAQMRTIFELSRYEGLKYTEIAIRLNISAKTVENQMSRALAKLREKLRHYLIMVVAALMMHL